ncbi:hypothetical protein MauCBS54593_006784 [Microsporum audouinii]
MAAATSSEAHNAGPQPQTQAPQQQQQSQQNPQSTSRSSIQTANSTSSYGSNVPLSARRAEPLDLSTVERREQIPATRDPPKRNRPHDLQEAPTFYPTEEEFKDPMAYIRKISPEGRKYGICKVVPPETWNPPFAIDTERFHFRTRRQELNSVEGGTRANLNYLDQLTKFHKQHGTSLTRFPSVDKRPLDLYKLKKAVEIRGGFEQVCKLKKWAEIGRDLGYSGKIMSSLSTSLKNSYQRWLQPYEEYLLVAKPGVQHQLEVENGGPFTPSPNQSPSEKKKHQMQNGHRLPSDTRADDNSSTQIASTGPNVSTVNSDDGTGNSVETPREATPVPIQQQPITSGFTAVNSRPSGFAAINTPSSFTAVNRAVPEVKRESDEATSNPPHAHSVPGSAKPSPDLARAKSNSAPLTNGHDEHTLKRVHSSDGNSQADNDDSEEGGNGRRSKRLKKDGAPSVAGSNMSLLRPSPSSQPKPKNGTCKTGDKCESCGKSDNQSSILACDGCEIGYHMQCLDPPLTTTPDYDWHCPKCLVGTGEYGFEEGGIYSLKQFQEKANQFKKNYFGTKLPIQNTSAPTPQLYEAEDSVEREFWRLVESLTETVEVEYGADIHSTTHGSGFPTVERNPLDPHATDPWNLNVLPLHPESLFRHIKSDVSGMTVPWVYVGMCFSTFCWHNEDHYAYSANYQHFGSTKTWYGIPGADAEAFEEAMRQAVPELFETQPDLLFQLVTLLPPNQLKKAGVNVYALDQRAGQFVITYPQAYHAGFNHGFNCNEAVNFAPSEWEPFGQSGVDRLQAFRRQPCFSHDEMLLTAAGKDTSIGTAKWLGKALRRMCDRELEQRTNLQARARELENGNGVPNGDQNAKPAELPALSITVEDTDLLEDEYQCSYCKAYSYLSVFRCHKSGKPLCLMHAGLAECCGVEPALCLRGTDHSVRYRLSDEDLQKCAQKVEDRAKIPEAWAERLDRTLEDEPKPSLKALHALLSEGEKIPYHLPGLQDLAAFVQKCDKWVEEANNYLTRKQQNRRKNEKIWRKGNPAKAAQMEERDRELRSIEKIHSLLSEADRLSFDCPQITALHEKVQEIERFQRDAQAVFLSAHTASAQAVEELVELGRNFSLDIPEVDKLERVLQQIKWNEDARRRREQYQTLEDCAEFIKLAEELNISEANNHLLHFREMYCSGVAWEAKAKELMSVEAVHYQQLEALSAQAARFPVSPDTLAAVDAILTKQREAQKQISSFYEKSKSTDFRKRPHYRDVRDLMESLVQLNSKPNGTIDLEREQKRHEDWMRKGKKLFGKANAPLHILKMHMQYVQKRNSYCFDLEDRFRPPVEPASREATPDGSGESQTWAGSRSKKKDVFCICRQQESGLMIECEICHEWYHGKCLKIARGKVKEYDSYTCPICDWRVKIPRDAARPKLEDLLEWQSELSDLPFQPEEEQLLMSIIEQASAFREFLRPFTNPACMTAEEVPTQIFYLRKIEGAEVLLAYETNYFRQEIHKWSPVAPEPPPILEQSLSTRKPRPTKQQKIMAQLGIEKPEDIPLHLRTKHHIFPSKRKSTEPQNGRPPPLQPAPPDRSNTPVDNPRSVSVGTDQVPPTLTATQPPQTPASYPFSHPFQLSSSEPNTTFGGGTGPFLAQGNGDQSPSFSPGSPAARHSGLDPSFFSPPSFERNHQLPQGSESENMKGTAGVGVDDVDANNPFGSSPRANMDDLFADLTNHDTEAEHVEEISHANEALEALKSAQACGSRTGSISEAGNNGTNGDPDLHENASHDGDNEHQNGGGLGEEYLS